MKHKTILFIFVVLSPYLVFIGRSDYLIVFLESGSLVSFLGELMLSFILLGITTLFGLYYLYLNNLILNERYMYFLHAFFSILAPAQIIGYKFNFIFSDGVLTTMYFAFNVLFILFGKGVYMALIGSIVTIEKEKGNVFPRQAPKTAIDLIPYHLAISIFFLLPLFSPH